MSNSTPRMKAERKNPVRYYVSLHRSTPDLLASGVATLTFDNGSYTLHFDTVDEALRRDRDAIVQDALRAYSRPDDEREYA